VKFRLDQSLSLSDSESDGRLSEVDEATLEFDKIMNAEELNYEPYNSSSSDLDADFAACDDLVSEIVRRSREIGEARVVKLNGDYEPVLVSSLQQDQVVVQEVQVREWRSEREVQEFEEICRRDGVAADENFDEQFEEICNQQSDVVPYVQTVESKFVDEVLNVEEQEKIIANSPELCEITENKSEPVESISVKTDVEGQQLPFVENLPEHLNGPESCDEHTQSAEKVPENLAQVIETAIQELESFDSADEQFNKVQIDFEMSKPLPIKPLVEDKFNQIEREIKLAKFNFLKTPLEDQILTSETIILQNPKSNATVSNEPPSLIEIVVILERNVEIDQSPYEKLELHSNEIISKFSSKLEEVNELVYERSSPVIMEQINLFARQLIDDNQNSADEAQNKSLFETNKDKLVSFIRGFSGMEAEQEEKQHGVQDVPNLLKILEQNKITAEEEEKTLTSLENVTQRLAEVLQNSLKRRQEEEEEEVEFGWSENESCKNPCGDNSSLSSSAALSTPLSPARSRSHSIDSNTSQVKCFIILPIFY